VIRGAHLASSISENTLWESLDHILRNFGKLWTKTKHQGSSIVNAWLQSRSLPVRGRVGLEVHRCLCIIDPGIVFISTVMG